MSSTKYAYHMSKNIILTAVTMKIAIFWYVTPCILVGSYKRFRGICCLHFQGRKINLHLLRLCLQRDHFPSYPSDLTNAGGLSRPSHSLWVDRPHNVCWIVKLWNSSFRSILHHPVTSWLLLLNILRKTLFSNALKSMLFIFYSERSRFKPI